MAIFECVCEPMCDSLAEHKKRWKEETGGQAVHLDGRAIAGHPSNHGTNCICMDDIIRVVRAQINSYPDRDTIDRVKYILRTAMR